MAGQVYSETARAGDIIQRQRSGIEADFTRGAAQLADSAKAFQILSGGQGRACERRQRTNRGDRGIELTIIGDRFAGEDAAGKAQISEIAAEAHHDRRLAAFEEVADRPDIGREAEALTVSIEGPGHAGFGIERGQGHRQVQPGNGSRLAAIGEVERAVLDADIPEAGLDRQSAFAAHEAGALCCRRGGGSIRCCEGPVIPAAVLCQPDRRLDEDEFGNLDPTAEERDEPDADPHLLHVREGVLSETLGIRDRDIAGPDLQLREDLQGDVAVQRYLAVEGVAGSGLDRLAIGRGRNHRGQDEDRGDQKDHYKAESKTKAFHGGGSEIAEISNWQASSSFSWRDAKNTLG